VRASHFRLASGSEVDLVPEDGQGRVAGVEVKAAATMREDDMKGLKALAALSGRAWAGGVVFYGGDTPLPFGPTLQAWPISLLWTGDRGAPVPPDPRQERPSPELSSFRHAGGVL